MPVSCLIVSCCLCFACYLHACTRHLRRTSVSCMHALDCQLWAGPLPRVCAPKFDWSMKKSKITPDWAVNVIENTALWILTACWAWCVVECRHCTLSWTTAGSCCALIGRGHNDDQYQQQWDVDVWTRGVRPAGGCVSPSSVERAEWSSCDTWRSVVRQQVVAASVNRHRQQDRCFGR